MCVIVHSLSLQKGVTQIIALIFGVEIINSILMTHVVVVHDDIAINKLHFLVKALTQLGRIVQCPLKLVKVVCLIAVRKLDHVLNRVHSCTRLIQGNIYKLVFQALDDVRIVWLLVKIVGQTPFIQLD